jgi:fumarate reductase flavoprotein subunit
MTRHTAAGRGLSKRRFLAGAGATVAAASSQAHAADKKAKPYDVAVVGAGTAGLPAAIFAARRGARVLLIEAAPQIGGTLFLSSAQMSAAGTKLQKSKGIVDTPQQHFDDVMRISHGNADPDIVRLATFNAADTFDWLMDSGLTVRPEHPITGTTHEPYSQARYAWAPGMGRDVIKVLTAQLQPEIDRGAVTVLTGTEAKSLIQDAKGAVIGVEVADEEGKAARHLARKVVLTTGGYCSNPEMFAKLEGVKRYADVSYPYSQGAGITMGLAAGGYVRGGNRHLPLFGAVLRDIDKFPSPSMGTVRPWPPTDPVSWIYVNQRGERFLREDVPSHDVQEHALRDQPEERCWMLFDDTILKEQPPRIGRWSKEEVAKAFDTYPAFKRADSLDDLAKAIGVDATGLKATVAAYNQGRDAKKDALGRQYMPFAIAKAPFYAVRLQSWLLCSFAGLAVDKELRVIRQDGAPIPNLYAAGELLGGAAFMGDSYCGGMFVTPAITFGRLLGQKLIPLST